MIVWIQSHKYHISREWTSTSPSYFCAKPERVAPGCWPNRRHVAKAWAQRDVNDGPTVLHYMLASMYVHTQSYIYIHIICSYWFSLIFTCIYIYIDMVPIHCKVPTNAASMHTLCNIYWHLVTCIAALGTWRLEKPVVTIGHITLTRPQYWLVW